MRRQVRSGTNAIGLPDRIAWKDRADQRHKQNVEVPMQQVLLVLVREQGTRTNDWRYRSVKLPANSRSGGCTRIGYIAAWLIHLSQSIVGKM